MRILRNISAFVVLALALSACVKETLVPVSSYEDRLSFLPATYLSGTKVEGSVFPTDMSFGCFAHASTDGTVWGTTNSPLYMDNQEVAYSNPSWLPTLDYYWPRAGKYVSFISYAPYDASSPWVTGTTARSLTAENVSPAADADWMYADLSADYSSASGAIPAIFRHALCRVKFNISANVGDNQSVVFVNQSSEHIDSSTETESTHLVDSVIVDNGNSIVKTKTTTYTITTVEEISQTTVTTSMTSPQTWDIFITNVAFENVVNHGTLSLTADESSHTFGTAEVLNWTGDWSLAEGANYEIVALPNPLSGTRLTNSPQELIATRSMIPQDLSRLVLKLDYNSTTVPANVTTEDRVDHWTKTTVDTYREVLVVDILNEKDISYETEVSHGIPTIVPGAPDVTIENINDGATPVTVTKQLEIGLDQQGGLTEWAPNKKITYNIRIEPTGKRITWDPAQVTNWDSANGDATISLD